MRHWILRGTVATLLVVGTPLAFAFSTGPPASHTGAPAVGGVIAENICRACHTTFLLNAAGATLAILDAPEFYLPGTVYTLRVRMTSTFAAPRRWGFEFTAIRAADGQGVGTFDITGTTGIQVVSGTGVFASRRYVEHNSTGTFANLNGPVEWTFKWQAPSTDVGRIFFFAAGNAANNSGSNTGDHIYTQRDTTDIHPLLGAPTPPVASLDVLEPAAPNPFRTSTSFGYALAEDGAVDLSIFDAQGRLVRTLRSGHRPAGRGTATWDGTRDDGGRAAPGSYFARLSTTGTRLTLSRRVILTR